MPSDKPKRVEEEKPIGGALAQILQARLSQMTGRILGVLFFVAYLVAHLPFCEDIPAIGTVRDGLFKLLVITIVAIFAPDTLAKTIRAYGEVKGKK